MRIALNMGWTIWSAVCLANQHVTSAQVLQIGHCMSVSVKLGALKHACCKSVQAATSPRCCLRDVRFTTLSSFPHQSDV
jgi:hypothetical protein